MVSELKFLLDVPTSIPLNIACMLPCSGLTAYNSVQKIKPFIAEATFIKGKILSMLNGKPNPNFQRNVLFFQLIN